MTLRIPKLVVFALGAVILVACGAAAHFLLIKSDSESCVSSLSGESAECESGNAISQEEYEAQQAEERRERRVATQTAAECRAQLSDFMNALAELDSRLSVGLTFAEYSAQVGDVTVAYDRVPFGQLGAQCVSYVGIPTEDALNSYVKANNIWNGCITDFTCRTNSIDPQLQAEWSAAERDVSDARSGLRDIAQA